MPRPKSEINPFCIYPECHEDAAPGSTLCEKVHMTHRVLRHGDFHAAVTDVLLDKATTKGYAGEASLITVTRDLPHPLGEIIYKAVRYARKHDPEDLVKIAAWAKLLWDAQQKEMSRGA